MEKEIVEKLRCKACGGLELVLDATELHGSSVREGTLTCRACGKAMHVVEGTIEDSPEKDRQSDIWDGLYREAQGENLQGLIAALEKGFNDPGLLEKYYPLVRTVMAMPANPVSSVELGCGSGAYSLVLKKLGLVREVTLVDYSAESLLCAKELFDHFHEECTLVHSSIESHPFREGAFDLSFSGGVIEHYRTTAGRLGCLESHLSVAEHAFVQAPVSSPCYWIQRAAVTALNWGWPFGYEKPVTLNEMKRLAALAGASIERIDYHFFLALLIFRVPRPPWFRRLVEPLWFTRPMQTELALLLTRSKS